MAEFARFLERKRSALACKPGDREYREFVAALQRTDVKAKLGVGYSVGCCSSQGKRDKMEDFSGVERIELAGGRPAQVLGIYDGHGGKECARFVASKLPKYIARCAQSIPDTATALRLAYSHTETQWIERMPLDASGTTALTVVLCEGHIDVAHVGDSRAVISVGGKAVRLTNDHKPDVEAERAGIVARGGVVTYPFKNIGRVDGNLAISRTLGDRLWKPHVSPEPDTSSRSVGPDDEYLILASDGLWDVLSDQAAVDVVKGMDSPGQMAKQLVAEAFRLGSLDNISVVVALLKRPLAPPSPTLQPTRSADSPADDPAVAYLRKISARAAIDIGPSAHHRAPALRSPGKSRSLRSCHSTHSGREPLLTHSLSLRESRHSRSHSGGSSMSNHLPLAGSLSPAGAPLQAVAAKVPSLSGLGNPVLPGLLHSKCHSTPPAVLAAHSPTSSTKSSHVTGAAPPPDAAAMQSGAATALAALARGDWPGASPADLRYLPHSMAAANPVLPSLCAESAHSSTHDLSQTATVAADSAAIPAGSEASHGSRMEPRCVDHDGAGDGGGEQAAEPPPPPALRALVETGAPSSPGRARAADAVVQALMEAHAAVDGRPGEAAGASEASVGVASSAALNSAAAEPDARCMVSVRRDAQSPSDNAVCGAPKRQPSASKDARPARKTPDKSRRAAKTQNGAAALHVKVSVPAAAPATTSGADAAAKSGRRSPVKASSMLSASGKSSSDNSSSVELPPEPPLALRAGKPKRAAKVAQEAAAPPSVTSPASQKAAGAAKAGARGGDADAPRPRSSCMFACFS